MQKIKKILIFVLCAFTVFITVGFSNVNAVVEETTIPNLIITPKTKNSATVQNGHEGLIVKYDTNGQSEIQITSGKYQNYVIKNYNYAVSKIGFNMKTNGSLSAKVSVTIGTNFTKDFTFKVNEDAYKYEYVELDNLDEVTGDIIINIERTGSKKSVYCNEVTIFPIVNTNSATVSFETGFTDVKVNPITVTKGETITRPENPVKEGYTFDDWYTTNNKDDLTKFDFSQPINASVKAYARWNEIPKFTVSFESNINTKIDNQIIYINEYAKEPTVKRENYIFTGWYTEKELQNKFNFETTPITSDIKLYAGWEAESYLNFLSVETHSSLNIKYNPNKVATTVSAYKQVTTAPEDWSGTYLLAVNLTYTVKVFDGTSETISKEQALIDSYIESTDDLALNEITIVKSNENYKIKFGEQYLSQSKNGKEIVLNGTGDEFMITLNSNDNTINIKNLNKTSKEFIIFNNNGGCAFFRYYDGTGNNMPAPSLYEKSEMTIETFDISSVSLRFGTIISKDDYDKMLADNAQFGVELTQKGEKAIEYICNPVRVNEKGLEDETGEFYQFAVVLKDIDIKYFDALVTAKCFVKINGVNHYALEKESSVKLTVQDYIDNGYDAYIDIFNAILNDKVTNTIKEGK